MNGASDMAFPIQASDLAGTLDAQSGLTKREYIATHAMNGLMATIKAKDRSLTPEVLAALVAPVAVMFADALLAELAKVQS